MLPPASTVEIVNIADPVFRLTTMRDTVRAVQAPGVLFYSLLNLVSTFIDGLVSPVGQTKVQYTAYLERHFPDLSAALGAEVFYLQYRCAAIHEFGLKAGYAIGRDHGMGGKYVATQAVRETGQVNTILNIDRLVVDFLSHVEQLLLQASGHKAP